LGFPAISASGTATARSVAPTTLATRMRRMGYPSAASAGAIGGGRVTVAQYTCGSGAINDGSGFMLVERFVESDPSVVAGKRAFCGMCNSTAAPTNVEPTTLTYAIGICKLSTDPTQ